MCCLTEPRGTVFNYFTPGIHLYLSEKDCGLLTTQEQLNTGPLWPTQTAGWAAPPSGLTTPLPAADLVLRNDTQPFTPGVLIRLFCPESSSTATRPVKHCECVLETRNDERTLDIFIFKPNLVSSPVDKGPVPNGTLNTRGPPTSSHFRDVALLWL